MPNPAIITEYAKASHTGHCGAPRCQLRHAEAQPESASSKKNVPVVSWNICRVARHSAFKKARTAAYIAEKITCGF
jgi:hypothetical protein